MQLIFAVKIGIQTFIIICESACICLVNFIKKNISFSYEKWSKMNNYVSKKKKEKPYSNTCYDSHFKQNFILF